MSTIAFAAPPTVARFMNSDGYFRLIAGPVGSGKTTGCMFELLKRAIQQRPAPDNVRYTRFAIVRQTLEQLRLTVLKDIQQWMGEIADWKVTDKTIYVNFLLEDSTRVNSEWLLIPLEDEADQRRLLSSQLTGAWMSEAIEMSVNLVPAIDGRCGRYPSALQGGASWHGIIADTNMPAIGSEWHDAFTDRPEGWKFFIQPGGLDDDAENLCWLLQTPESLKLPLDHPERLALGRSYYERLATNKNSDWVDRYVNAKFGADPSGQTVFKGSFRSHHIAEELEPCRGRNLIIAQDFGRNPCSLIMQQDELDRMLVLEEVLGSNISLETHIAQNLRPALLHERYFGLPLYFIGDPSGNQQGAVFDTNPFTYLRQQHFLAYPAPTNDIDRRLGAVEQWLLKMGMQGPMLLIDRHRCPKLVEGMLSRYRYAKRRNDQLAPKPEKLHPWSDFADCLQYGCLAAGNAFAPYLAQHMARTRSVPTSRPRQRITPGAWT